MCSDVKHISSVTSYTAGSGAIPNTGRTTSNKLVSIMIEPIVNDQCHDTERLHFDHSAHLHSDPIKHLLGHPNFMNMVEIFWADGPIRVGIWLHPTMPTKTLIVTVRVVKESKGLRFSLGLGLAQSTANTSSNA